MLPHSLNGAHPKTPSKNKGTGEDPSVNLHGMAGCVPTELSSHSSAPPVSTPCSSLFLSPFPTLFPSHLHCHPISIPSTLQSQFQFQSPSQTQSPSHLIPSPFPSIPLSIPFCPSPHPASCTGLRLWPKAAKILSGCFPCTQNRTSIKSALLILIKSLFFFEMDSRHWSWLTLI